jgi:pimeloyl-ACP methyl ester carboxylesterase
VTQDALRAAIAGARLVTDADAGHAPHWEEPPRVAADLVAFVGATLESRSMNLR